MSYRATQRLVEAKLIKKCESPWQDAPDWFYLYDEKKPKQIPHQHGKGWIYTSLSLRVLASQGQLRLVYYKDDGREFTPSPDAYAVTEHRILGRNHIFGEFQVTESDNQWDKDYPTLFQDFAEDEFLTLMIVTTGPYKPLKELLVKQMSPFKNVRLEFFTLDKLKEYCWRITLELREKYRQQHLLQEGR